MKTRIHIRLVAVLVLAAILASVAMAQDGAHVALTEAGDVAYGTVRLADNITTVVINGENGPLTCRPENGVLRLPVGKYRADSWIIARTDEAGARWEMRGILRLGGAAAFTVARNQEVSLPFGEPIYSIVQVNRSGSIYLFDQKLQGRQDERIVLTRNGLPPLPPKLRIRSRDGTYDRSIIFAYG